jgi:hypothetical protein
MGNLLEIRGHSYCRILEREILLNGEATDWVRTAASYETDARSCLPDRWPPPECSFASSGLCHCEPSAASAFLPGVRFASAGECRLPNRRRMTLRVVVMTTRLAWDE